MLMPQSAGFNFAQVTGSGKQRTLETCNVSSVRFSCRILKRAELRSQSVSEGIAMKYLMPLLAGVRLCVTAVMRGHVSKTLHPMWLSSPPSNHSGYGLILQSSDPGFKQWGLAPNHAAPHSSTHLFSLQLCSHTCNTLTRMACLFRAENIPTPYTATCSGIHFSHKCHVKNRLR